MYRSLLHLLSQYTAYTCMSFTTLNSVYVLNTETYWLVYMWQGNVIMITSQHLPRQWTCVPYCNTYLTLSRQMSAPIANWPVTDAEWDSTPHIQPSVLSAVCVCMCVRVCVCVCVCVWRFGEDSQERVVDWLDDNEDVSKEDTILDLGCGNGALLLELVSACMPGKWPCFAAWVGECLYARQMSCSAVSVGECLYARQMSCSAVSVGECLYARQTTWVGECLYARQMTLLCCLSWWVLVCPKQMSCSAAWVGECLYARQMSCSATWVGECLYAGQMSCSATWVGECLYARQTTWVGECLYARQMSSSAASVGERLCSRQTSCSAAPSLSFTILFFFVSWFSHLCNQAHPPPPPPPSPPPPQPPQQFTVPFQSQKVTAILKKETLGYSERMNENWCTYGARYTKMLTQAKNTSTFAQWYNQQKLSLKTWSMHSNNTTYADKLHKTGFFFIHSFSFSNWLFSFEMASLLSVTSVKYLCCNDLYHLFAQASACEARSIQKYSLKLGAHHWECTSCWHAAEYQSLACSHALYTRLRQRVRAWCIA